MRKTFVGPILNQTRMRKTKNIHFVGIGGVGMAGIAEVLLTQGYCVSGSDVSQTPLTERLASLGAVIYHDHQAIHVLRADVVVVSSAIGSDNIELRAACKLQIPVVPRALMLGELMRLKQGIAIAGTHGKTTTTSLIANIFSENELEPTFVIGGKLNSSGANARLGTGDYFIAEADESDASFLHLNPMIAVVTNIDNDHMATYENDFEKLKSTFISFLHHLPFYGVAVLCIDCPVVHSLLPKVARPYITYGFHPDADIRAVDFHQIGTQTHFKIKLKGDDHLYPFQLNLPGKHNVKNALAAFTVAYEEGISVEAIAKTFASFGGINRRFQCYGEIVFNQSKALMVDDYGHHPEEIRATIQAARLAWPEKRLVMVFQPHRYSRTKFLLDDLADVLSEVDQLCLMEVYAAGESHIPGGDGLALYNAIQQRKKTEAIFVTNNEALSSILDTIIGKDDVILMQGAGGIGRISAQLAEERLAS